jgi:large repetitive protein
VRRGRGASTGRGAGQAVAVALATAALAAPAAAQGATLQVTRTDDPAPGGCTASDCSLREAVQAAGATAANDRIRLRARRYELTQAGANEDAGVTGDLDAVGGSGTLHLVGKGRAKTTIESATDDRILNALTGSKVTLEALALRGGEANQGGAIRNEGRVVLARAALRSSEASFGGGIFNNGESRLTLRSSLVAGNRAGFGGGIYNNNESRVTVVRSLLRSNTADGVGGGAIYNQNTATLLVRRSTIHGNQASAAFVEGGGGILNQNEANARIVSSTISGNSSTDAGGGIYAKNASTLELVNSTVSGNTAERGGGILVWQQARVGLEFATVARNRASIAGGGVFDDSVAPGPPAPPYLMFRGSIVGLNRAPGATDNCRVGSPAAFASRGANLEDTNTCRFNRASDRRSARAGLRRLARNGGSTKTHALKPSSDALGLASRQGCPSRDQRGVRRPQGRRCDSGSFELER